MANIEIPSFIAWARTDRAFAIIGVKPSPYRFGGRRNGALSFQALGPRGAVYSRCSLRLWSRQRHSRHGSFAGMVPSHASWGLTMRSRGRAGTLLLLGERQRGAPLNLYR
jgi:hypothetical protein